jgi:NADPH:quinone reductase-like Zn-dependent oxidoreductase
MITARKGVAAGFGGPEVLRNIEVDVPDPGPGQVTVGVRACGMNPADAKHIAPGQDPNLLPLSIGFEVAGVLTALGLRRVRQALGVELCGSGGDVSLALVADRKRVGHHRRRAPGEGRRVRLRRRLTGPHPPGKLALVNE